MTHENLARICGKVQVASPLRPRAGVGGTERTRALPIFTLSSLLRFERRKVLKMLLLMQKKAPPGMSISCAPSLTSDMIPYDTSIFRLVRIEAQSTDINQGGFLSHVVEMGFRR